MSYFEHVKKASSLQLPWEKLSGKNILITGATGMIGSTLVDVLMARENINYHVYASGRDETKINTVFAKYRNSKYFHFFPHDVCEPLDGNIRFHYMIDSAGVASPQLYSMNPVSVVKSNLWGVDNLLSYGVKHELEKFVFISSGEVYGEGDGQVFDENYSGYVNCATLRACYPSAKRAAESLCIAYGSQFGIDVNIARPCHVYGPHFTDSDRRVYAQFIRNVIQNENIVMKSTGSQYRSWCYSVDCSTALLYILLNGKTGEAYNIADESSNITIKELAELVADIGNCQVVIDAPDATEKAGFNIVTKSIFSTEKLRKLGWAIDGTMREKMQSVIDFVRDLKNDGL